MKFALRGVSGAALLFGLAGAANAQQANNQTVNTSQPAVQAPTSGPQVAQTGPQAAPEAAQRVVVTGSLIATTPEDAPKPVEVYGKEQLKEQGNPSVSDFVRSLSVSAGSNLGFGQANPQVPTGSGFTSADIRGLGPNATMTLLNGHNMTPANGQFGADLNTVPLEALEAVEVLKDGASSTYGAGAVGGVLNFRTRRDVNGPQVIVEKRFYAGGDGNLKINLIDGWKGDAGNLLVTFDHEHEGAMSATKRDFSNEPFAVNPSEWADAGGQPFGGNPGGFNAIATPFLSGAACTGTVGGCTGGFVPTTAVTGAAVSPLVEDLPGGATFTLSPTLGLFGNVATPAATQACQAIGGQIVNQIQKGALESNAKQADVGCAYSLAPMEDLISDTTLNRVYAEFNANLSDTMEVHFDVGYTKNYVIQNNPPSGVVTSRATDGSITGNSSQCGGTNALTSQTGCFFVVPASVNTYTNTGLATSTATANPFIADFMARTGVSAAQLPSNGALYTGQDWRPVLFGGNPAYNNGLTQDNFTREQLTINAGAKGELSDNGLLGRLGLGKLFGGISYDFNGQYNQYLQTDVTPDFFVSRLQNALLGYGGPACNAVDRVPTDFSSAAAFNRTVGIQSDQAPGTNGCQWFNPFASSFPTSIINGAANPQFNAGAPVLAAGSTQRPTGYQNPANLVDWMMGNKEVEDLYQSGTFDYTLTGELPKNLQLPGGKIGWAAGTEWRMTQRQDSTNDPNAAEKLMNTQKCPFPDPSVVEQVVIAGVAVNNPNSDTQQPGSRGCLTGAGAFTSSGFTRANTGETIPNYHDTQDVAYFGEVTLPILDNLSLDGSVRRENYNGGKIGATIYNVSGKYSITNNFYLRGSYGTNFRADTALDLSPGTTTQSSPQTARFGNQIVPTFTTVAPNLNPEDDKTQNFGFGYKNNDILGGRLRASIDWWQVQINGFVTTATSATVYNNVFGLNTVAGTAPNPAAGQGGAQNNRGNPLIPNSPTSGLGTLTNSNGQFADCGASLVGFITFNSPCVTGVTTAANILAVTQFQLNGPSFATNGLDYTFDYSHPLMDGNVGVNFTATEDLVYKADAFTVNGVLFSPATHNLGYANWTHQGAGGTDAGQGVGNSRWKANATLRWSNTEHSFNLRANYDSGRYDERFDPTALATSLPLTSINGTLGTPPILDSTYGIARKNYLDFDVGYIYTPQWMKGLEFQVQVIDLLDRNPPLGQFQTGYGSGIGDPRKRTFVFRASDKF